MGVKASLLSTKNEFEMLPICVKPTAAVPHCLIEKLAPLRKLMSMVSEYENHIVSKGGIVLQLGKFSTVQTLSYIKLQKKLINFLHIAIKLQNEIACTYLIILPRTNLVYDVYNKRQTIHEKMYAEIILKRMNLIRTLELQLEFHGKIIRSNLKKMYLLPPAMLIIFHKSQVQQYHNLLETQTEILHQLLEVQTPSLQIQIKKQLMQMKDQFNNKLQLQ